MFETSLTWNDVLFLLQGAGTTLTITFWAVLGGTILGMLFGLIRATSPWWVNAPIGFVLDILRSVPLLIQFVLANSFKSILKLQVSAFTVGCVVLALYTAAYCAEIVRGGVLAVPLTTRRAARSLGMTYMQDLTNIVFPMALRVALPELDRPHARRHEGHSAGSLDRHRRTAAGLADHRDPHPGAAVRSVDRGPDLLPHELPDRTTRRAARKEVARK